MSNPRIGPSAILNRFLGSPVPAKAEQRATLPDRPAKSSADARPIHPDFVLPPGRRDGLHSLRLGLVLQILAAIAAARLFYDMALWLRYELKGAYNVDTPMYWAVGRGIQNGLKPWQDLFENKPPGIFVVSYLSVVFSDNFTFVHIVQAATLAGMALLPIAIFAGERRWRSPSSALPRAFLVPGFALLARFTADHAGEVQTESFGAFFAAAYVAVLAWRGPMRRSVRWLLIGICLTGSVGFKEPYLFTTAAIVLIMRPRPRQWLEDYVIPAALTGVACGILFLLAGWVRPLHGYLQYMLGTHVTLFGSPWRRALDVVKLIDELNEFLPLLGWLVVVAAVGALASQLQREPASLRPLVGARWVAAIYLTSFAVGLGGHYWQHHYVLAVPAYLAWFVELWPYSDHPAALRMPQVIALPLLLVLILGLPAYTAERLDSKLAPFASRSQQAQKSAKYIDAVLDRFGEKRWLFLGQWQMQAYAWTHHSPAGPMFSQMSAFMQTSAAFRKDVLIQLDEAHFVAEYSLVDLGAELQATVKARLEKDFSTTIPPCIQSLDQEGGLDYHYHFRKPIEKLCERR